MNFTSRSRYALKLMLDIAGEEGVVGRAAMSKRQGIEPDYSAQILGRLRTAGLVDSIRGPMGGYKLAKRAEEISLWDIFKAVEQGIEPVACLSNHCELDEYCGAHEVWKVVFESMMQSLEGLTLAQFVHKMPPAPAGVTLTCRGSA